MKGETFLVPIAKCFFKYWVRYKVSTKIRYASVIQLDRKRETLYIICTVF
jgi:hypothetical protein